jgi:AcrR family transcriptional regulator
MARPIPSDRFAALIRVATEVFLERGYRRTQMADVAEALGVAKGTLYLYVESKEALFEQVLLHADGPAAIPSPDSLPVPSPEPGSTLSKVRERLLRDAHLPALTDALARRRVSNVRGEIEAIFRELYRLLAAHRVAIKLLDRCARPSFRLSQGSGAMVVAVQSSRASSNSCAAGPTWATCPDSRKVIGWRGWRSRSSSNGPSMLAGIRIRIRGSRTTKSSRPRWSSS